MRKVSFFFIYLIFVIGIISSVELIEFIAEEEWATISTNYSHTLLNQELFLGITVKMVLIGILVLSFIGFMIRLHKSPEGVANKVANLDKVYKVIQYSYTEGDGSHTFKPTFDSISTNGVLPQGYASPSFNPSEILIAQSILNRLRDLTEDVRLSDTQYFIKTIGGLKKYPVFNSREINEFIKQTKRQLNSLELNDLQNEATLKRHQFNYDLLDACLQIKNILGSNSELHVAILGEFSK